MSTVAIFNSHQHKGSRPQIKSNTEHTLLDFFPCLPLVSTWKILSGGLLPSSHLRGHIHNNKNVSRALHGDSAKRQQAKWEIVWKIIPWYVQSVKCGQGRHRLNWIRNGASLSHYSADLDMPVQHGMPRLCGCLVEEESGLFLREFFILFFRILKLISHFLTCLKYFHCLE